MKLFYSCALLLLFYGQVFSQLKVDANNHLFLNHNTSQIGSASFTLSESNNGYGGMYINSTGPTTKWPFYGYAVDNLASAWHYYNNLNESWNLNVGGPERLRVSVDTSWVLNEFVGLQSMRLQNSLTIGGVASPAFKLSPTDGLLINTDQRFNAFTDLTLNSNSNTFAGMMINVNDANSGKPFYGYAINGEERAYTFYEPLDGALHTLVGDENTTVSITEAYEDRFQINGTLLLNTDSQINSFTEFTLKSKSTTFGGMYVDVPGTGFGQPFYGYSLNGSEKAYHYYDELFGAWGLYVSNATGAKEIVTAGSNYVSINGYTRLNNDEFHPNSSQGPAGTIYFKDGHFYGKITGNSFRQLDNTTNAAKTEGNALLIEELKAENQKLREEMQALRKEMLEIVDMIEAMKQ